MNQKNYLNNNFWTFDSFSIQKNIYIFKVSHSTASPFCALYSYQYLRILSQSQFKKFSKICNFWNLYPKYTSLKDIYKFII
jgi:hypothetical protein